VICSLLQNLVNYVAFPYHDLILGKLTLVIADTGFPAKLIQGAANHLLLSYFADERMTRLLFVLQQDALPL
jgi:hypothetical protein